MCYLCVHRTNVVNSPHLLNASHNSIELTSPKCSQIHSTSLYTYIYGQTWTLHVPCYTVLCCMCCYTHSSVTPGYLPQWNTVTLEEQMPRYNCRLHACDVKSSVNQQIYTRIFCTVLLWLHVLLCSEFALWRLQTCTIFIAKCLSTVKATGRYS